jgi:hypothetical protein
MTQQRIRRREAQRRPGSKWLKNHPRWLEPVYGASESLLRRLYPALKRLHPGLAARVLIWGEKVIKGYIFNCQMCGQCILHSTGMTCPMNCPKNLRNGPCGGVRPDGGCEVIPSMPCVWVQAWQRTQQMPRYGAEIHLIQPPLDRRLQDSSAWANLLEGHHESPSHTPLPRSLSK